MTNFLTAWGDRDNTEFAMVNYALAAPTAADVPVAWGDITRGDLFAVTRASAPTRPPTSDIDGTASPPRPYGRFDLGTEQRLPSAAIPACNGICAGVPIRRGRAITAPHEGDEHD